MGKKGYGIGNRFLLNWISFWGCDPPLFPEDQRQGVSPSQYFNERRTQGAFRVAEVSAGL